MVDILAIVGSMLVAASPSLNEYRSSKDHVLPQLDEPAHSEVDHLRVPVDNPEFIPDVEQLLHPINEQITYPEQHNVLNELLHNILEIYYDTNISNTKLRHAKS